MEKETRVRRSRPSMRFSTMKPAPLLMSSPASKKRGSTLMIGPATPERMVRKQSSPHVIVGTGSVVECTIE
ncbi:hypothetical protein AB1Y20_006986 [Prymnesium parvum]|uniref:Uncharacterized protein n=1 Tax=Prymnesium parvum TaxID=97485 RepID=A0AB34J0H6_PRYPA